MTGKEILTLGNKHVGESHILGYQLPIKNKSWNPWDEIVLNLSPLVFQISWNFTNEIVILETRQRLITTRSIVRC